MEKVVREIVGHSFQRWLPNFLLFFAFYLLLPVLPMYLSEALASRSTAGSHTPSYHHGADDTSVRRVYGRYLSP